MLYGSGEGFRIGARMKITRTATRQLRQYAETDTKPIRLMNSMTSGNWNPMPKANGRNSTRLSHSLIRISGSKPSHSLKPKRNLSTGGNAAKNAKSAPETNSATLNG